MYLNMRAWFSSSCHCDAVNGYLLLLLLLLLPPFIPDIIIIMISKKGEGRSYRDIFQRWNHGRVTHVLLFLLYQQYHHLLGHYVFKKVKNLKKRKKTVRHRTSCRIFSVLCFLITATRQFNLHKKKSRFEKGTSQ